MGVAEDEQARLDAYNAQQAQRARNDRARKAALSGDPIRKREFDARWEPLQRWLAENGPQDGDKPWT